MKKPLLFGLLLSFFALFFMSCGKDDDESLDPSTGSVKGSVSPANGATHVYLVAGTDTVPGSLSASGAFDFNSVPPGAYDLIVKPAARYAAPAPVPVTVVAGTSISLPEITLTLIPVSNHISFDLEGTTYEGTVLYGTFFNQIIFDTKTHTLVIGLPASTLPGTYTTADSDFNVSISEQGTGTRWISNNAMGYATLSITSSDPATGRGSATFSFSAVGIQGAPGSKNATNGILTDVRLQ